MISGKRSIITVLIALTCMVSFAEKAHARRYLASIGRFDSRDPLGHLGVPDPVRGSSPRVGLYTYANTQPYYAGSGTSPHLFASVGSGASYHEGGSPNGNLYGYVLNRPTHYVDPYGEAPSFNVNTVSASAGPCGRVQYYVSFALRSPSPKGGVFTQKIRLQIEVKDCSGNITYSLDSSYYETWEVSAGSTTPTLSGTTPGGNTYHDGFTAADRGNCTKGHAKWRGKIRFFENKHTPTGWSPGGVPYSGILPSSPDKPDFWTPIDTAFATRHTATHKWDCCPTPQSQSFSHKP